MAKLLRRSVAVETLNGIWGLERSASWRLVFMRCGQRALVRANVVMLWLEVDVITSPHVVDTDCWTGPDVTLVRELIWEGKVMSLDYCMGIITRSMAG